MAVKRKLSDLVSDLVAEESPKVTESPTLVLADSVSLSLPTLVENVPPSAPERPASVSKISPIKTEVPELQKSELPNSVTTETPKYLTFERKEARLRFDQVTSLVNLTKSINRKRKGRGERITDNTLIRVAVDLLLSKADLIEGTTEEEIRAVLGL